MTVWRNRVRSGTSSSASSAWTSAALGFAVLLLAGLIPSGGASADPKLTTLYRFTGWAHGDGQFPVTSSGLVTDAHDVLYGTTFFGGNNAQCGSNPFGNSGCGTAFRIAPPRKKSPNWREQVIYSFQILNDGANPNGGLLRGKFGVLYGTTINGTGEGVGLVFQLAPPTTPHGAWSETTLYDFQGGADGASPYSGLLLDPKTGALLGTTRNGGQGQGTVFQLLPGSAGWTESIIYALQGNDGSGPVAGLLRDKTGALWSTAEFGANYGEGFVFAISQGQPGQGVLPGPWTEVESYDFPGYLWSANPGFGVLLQINTGEIIGTTVAGGDFQFCQGGCGTVYKMVPPATPGGHWAYRVIHRFHGGTDGAQPWGGLIKGPDGVLFGTTTGGGNGGFCAPIAPDALAKPATVGPSQGCGTIYKLTPPPKGKTYWPETVLYHFKGRLDGGQPYSTLFRNHKGLLFGTASMGGLHCPAVQGCGTVFMLEP